MKNSFYPCDGYGGIFFNVWHYVVAVLKYLNEGQPHKMFGKSNAIFSHFPKG